MPPKADRKEKPVKGDDAEIMVLEYLRSVNRPFASTDVSANLKNRVTKAEAQKALLSLTEKQGLTMKPYGKQTIFVFNQSSLPVLDPEEMTLLDDKLKEAKAKLDERRKELKAFQFELASLENQPATKELNQQIQEVTAENELTLNALRAFRGESAAPPMSAKETALIDAEWVRWRKEWTTRKKTYKEIFGLLSDGGMVTGSQADFEEEHGVDNDDEETKAVEAGEFCQLRHAHVKRKHPASVGSTGRTPSAKRVRA